MTKDEALKMAIEAKSVTEARKLGLKRFNTGKPCKHGHFADRLASSGECVVCLDTRNKAWKLQNKSHIKETKSIWNNKNKSHVQEYARQYQKDNTYKFTSNVAKRKSAQLQRTPMWADNLIIREIYAFAEEFRECGIDVHVDHILPLLGKKVSGLHVPDNLRVCLASVNIIKSNKLEENLL